MSVKRLRQTKAYSSTSLLGKLLKHDFLQTGRVFLWLLVGGLVGAGVGALLSVNKDIAMAQMIAGVLWNSLLVIFAAILESIGMFVILVSTNRSLFTERGLLTFGLPVSSTALLFSKFFSNLVLILANITVGILLFYCAAQNVKMLFLHLKSDVLEKFNISPQEIAFDFFGFPSFREFLPYLAAMLLILIMIMILVMMDTLFVLTISHVRPFSIAPEFWIPAFLILTGALFIYVTLAISKALPLNFVIRLNGLIDTELPKINITSAATMLGLSTGLFFLTNYFLKKKISLK